MDTREAVARVYRHLGGDADARCRLATAAGAADETLEVDRGLSQVTVDAKVELPHGELVYVWDVDKDTSEVTVERELGGEPAEPVDAGAILRVNPRWPYTHAVEALVEEAATLPAEGLFVMETAEVDYDYQLGGLDLTDLRDVMLDGHPYGIEHAWGGQRYWLRDWTVDQTLLRVPAYSHGTFTVYYRTGLPELPVEPLEGWPAELDRLSEIVTLGAAMRLQADSALSRMDHERYMGVRGGEDLPHSGPVDGASVLQSRRQSLIDLELARQIRQWPLRSR